VVATRVGGIPEVVLDEKTGLLVPPRDTGELARAIMSLVENEEKRRHMGDTVKNWIDEKFSASRMVRKIAEIYDEVPLKESGQVH
jgi:glycosyltransferase involved in cell wall biosynthesis